MLNKKLQSEVPPMIFLIFPQTVCSFSEEAQIFHVKHQHEFPASDYPHITPPSHFPSQAPSALMFRARFNLLRMVALQSSSHFGNQITLVPTTVKVLFEFQETVGMHIFPKCSFTANMNIININMEKYSPCLLNSGNFNSNCKYSCYKF